MFYRGKEAALFSQIYLTFKRIAEEEGYEFIILPTLLNYHRLVRRSTEEQLGLLFKVISPEGELFALRHDSTLLLLETLGKEKKKGMNRFSYWNNVFRAHKDRGGEEVWQAGLECLFSLKYLNHEVYKEEASLIEVTLKLIKEFGINDFIIDISDARFYHTFKKRFPEIESNLKSVFASKDAAALNEIKEKNILTPQQVELLSLFLYAPFSSLPPEKIFEEADSLINLSKDFEMKEILNSLKLLWQELERRGMTEYIFFDLGKLPKWGEYYSSLIFEVLTKNKNPLCSGGRYDKLYQEFLNDEDAGGCGCAFYINSIIQKKC